MYAQLKSETGGPLLLNDPVRLVLHVAEAGLRSTLVARLTMGGVDVHTMRELTPDRPPPVSRGAMVLIIDEAGLRDYPGAAEALYGDRRWAKLVVLTEAGLPHGAPAHLHHLDAVAAAAAIPAMLDDWKRGR